MDGDRRPLVAAAAIDAGSLPFGSGLLALVRPALARLPAGGVVALISGSAALREDLPRWCRIEHHDYLGCDPADGARDRHLVARGPLGGESGAALDDAMPALGDPRSGFAPRGARVEPGAPAYPFTLLDREHVAPPEIADLYRQAAGASWSVEQDIPWQRIPPLPDALEQAVGQVMGFLAQNELSALYVPARFLPRVHPAYAEVAMFLATQLADEARHVDAFVRRARRAGTLGVATVTTAHSLLTLLEAAVRRRAATLAGTGGVPAPVQDLVLLAAGSTDPAALERGADAFRTLLETMHEARIRRLRSAGFAADQAARLSELHTPNFM